MKQDPVRIRTVKSSSDLRKFILFPEKLYKDNPYWVPSLFRDEINTLSPFKNPAFAHCEACYWMAYRGNEPVGRIAGIINHHANRDWGIKAARFSWLDFKDDPEVSLALMQTLESWAKEKNMESVQGPLGFTDMDKEGLLTEGFDKIPTIATWYQAPYYLNHLQGMDFVKEAEWVQHIFQVPETVPDKIKTYSSLVKHRFGLRVLEARSASEVAAFGPALFEALNRAFVPLYGFTPLSSQQIQAYVNQYLPMVDPRFVCIILDKDSKVVGFAITLPSLSRAMQKSRGKLFPFGFFHILKALRNCQLVDMYLIGIVPEYQNKGLNTLLFDHLLHNFIQAGVKQVIANPQLEDNYRVRSLFEAFDGEVYMRRQSLIKKL